MSVSQSAYDLVRSSLRLIGAIATGETPTADEANDGLNTLNDMLDSWSTESLSIYGSNDETFSTVPGQLLYTIGPAGNFNTTRPVRISGAYCTLNNVDFPITIIGQSDYDLISLKTMQQQLVERLCYINDSPLGLIKLWPVPSAAIPLVLNTDRVLTNIPLLSTTIAMPPGYSIAMRYTLGILMCPDYGIQIDPQWAGIATATKANLKRANKQKRTSQFDPALCGDDTVVLWQTGN